MIKEMIKDNTAKFMFYRKGEMWYEISYDGGKTFQFPVPLDDVGDATLLPEDKAMLFMRYIRKQLKSVDSET